MKTKLTFADLEAKIKHKEYARHTTPTGVILRWCILTLENGFAVTGKPSACVDPSNDNEEIGEKIAYENAIIELWVIEGYLLKENLYRNKCLDLK